jgi:Tfp pilus assembly protein FimV
MRKTILVAALMTLTVWPLHAADESPAAIAEREAAEEREKRLNTRIEDLERTVQKYQERMSALNEEMRGLRDEIGRLREANNESAAKENIKRLKEAVEEVDKRRIEDNKKLYSALEEFRDSIPKIMANSSSRPATAAGSTTTKQQARNTHPGSNPPKKETETGYEYTVVERDTLSAIAAKLRQKNIKVTSRQIMDANPDVKWEKLQVGQKIFIPGT